MLFDYCATPRWIIIDRQENKVSAGFRPISGQPSHEEPIDAPGAAAKTSAEMQQFQAAVNSRHASGTLSRRSAALVAPFFEIVSCASVNHYALA